ncbi:MAG: TIR domain-containing protein, partial [Alphaproteobacteria bacterium]
MADIFVSYARADKTRVAPLVAALESQGWSVWWDPEITPGQEFDQLILRELRAAKAAIVVWTPASVGSRWVRGEAREAADRGILVPVRFESAELPLDARSLHTTDLDDWRQDVESAHYQEVVRAVRALVKAPAESGAEAPKTAKEAQVRLTAIVGVDVAGYSARTEADASVSAQEVIALRERLAKLAGRHGGRIFNTAGDGIMMEFAAAREAAAAIFQLLDERPEGEPEIRVGAHLGDVTVTQNGDLLGHGVNVAARLLALAEPGHALISQELR